MPAYSFRCRKCKKDIEVLHSFSQPHPTKHAGCGGRLVRKFTAPEVVYKGSGFYSTDKRLDRSVDDE